MQFREIQSSYFGKKGMSLHADVFLMKENGIIKKKTFYDIDVAKMQKILCLLLIMFWNSFQNTFPV